MINKGKKIGRLSAIKWIKNRGPKAMWLFKCDCGGTKISDGRAMSCGCLQKEASIKNLQKITKHYSKDLTNKRFGRLIALSPTSERKFGKVVWLCVCDCGNYKKADTLQLHTGQTRSCGCLYQESRRRLRSHPLAHAHAPIWWTWYDEAVLR